MSLYNAKTVPSGTAFTKFDTDLNPLTINIVSADGRNCSCPAGFRQDCRHRTMLGHFQAAKAINSERFFDYETRSWHEPIAKSKKD
jgi:hypothetical protein